MEKYRYLKPITMPRGKNYGSNYWLYYSRKIGRKVTAYSNLEYDNLISLEMNANIEYYCEQPCKAEVFYDGEMNITVFDVYVFYKDKREEMQEIKYSFDLCSDRAIKQHEVQKNWCLQNEIDLAIRTEKEIMPGNYTSRNNAWLASKVRRRDNTEYSENAHLLLNYIRSKGSITIGMLITSGRLSELNGISYLAELFYRGKI